jgi:hypothetical protein
VTAVVVVFAAAVVVSLIGERDEEYRRGGEQP